MIRLYAITFFAITAMVTPLLLLAQVPVMQSRYDGEVQVAVEASIPYGQWLGWIVNLAIAGTGHPAYKTGRVVGGSLTLWPEVSPINDRIHRPTGETCSP